MTLAIIPARGNSKGVPRKNIAPVAAQPLISWRIQQALAARQVQRVIVSTEDDEIAAVSREYGAETPFMRPAHLSEDTVTNVQVVRHALQWVIEQEAYTPDYVCVLQPTSPLCRPQDIDAAIDLAQRKQADTVISVTPQQPKLHWLRTLSPDQSLAAWLPDAENVQQRQQMPTLYAVNGAIYVIRTSYLQATHRFEGGDTYGYVMSPEDTLDIDTYFDLYLADRLLRDRNRPKNEKQELP